MYYRNAQAALVVYDLTKPSSLIKARHWVAELQRQASPGIVIALVGNKVDLAGEDDSNDSATANGENEGGDAPSSEGEEAPPAAEGSSRKISTKEGREYAEEEALLFFETSAKSGANVQEVFEAIANAIPETSMKGRTGAGQLGGAGGQGGAAERVTLGQPGKKEGGDSCAC